MDSRIIKMLDSIDFRDKMEKSLRNFKESYKKSITGVLVDKDMLEEDIAILEVYIDMFKAYENINVEVARRKNHYIESKI